MIYRLILIILKFRGLMKKITLLFVLSITFLGYSDSYAFLRYPDNPNKKINVSFIKEKIDNTKILAIDMYDLGKFLEIEYNYGWVKVVDGQSMTLEAKALYKNLNSNIDEIVDLVKDGTIEEEL